MANDVLEEALRVNRIRLSVDILRRKAKEAADLAESLNRTADSIEKELPPAP